MFWTFECGFQLNTASYIIEWKKNANSPLYKKSHSIHYVSFVMKNSSTF